MDLLATITASPGYSPGILNQPQWTLEEARGINLHFLKRTIAALENGGYRQIEGKLNDGEGGFCGTGVYLDVLVQDGIGFWQKNPCLQVVSVEVDGEAVPKQESGYRLEYEGDWVKTERLVPGSVFQKIITFNDTYKLSFPRLAEKLRELLVWATLEQAQNPRRPESVGHGSEEMTFNASIFFEPVAESKELVPSG